MTFDWKSLAIALLIIGFGALLVWLLVMSFWAYGYCGWEKSLLYGKKTLIAYWMGYC